jgi:hypothetical protein
MKFQRDPLLRRESNMDTTLILDKKKDSFRGGKKKGMPSVNFNDFDAIRLSVASSEEIRSWSHGEVRKPENDHDPVEKEEDILPKKKKKKTEKEETSMEVSALSPKDAFLASFMTLMKSGPAKALADAYSSGDKKSFEKAWRLITASLVNKCAGNKPKTKKKGFNMKSFASLMNQ